MPGAVSRLEDLKRAADDYFSKEQARLSAQADFIDAILRARNSAVTVQDITSDYAGGIMVDSINDYLGTPLDNAE